MDLSAHLRAILQRKWQILVASLLIAGLVFAWRSTAPRTYQASALLNVTSSRVAQGDQLTEPEALFLSDTYGSLAETRPVVDAGLKEAGLQLDLDGAMPLVSADASQAGYLSIVARGSSPAAASALSQGVAEALIEAVELRQGQQAAEQISILTPQLLEAASAVATTPITDPRRESFLDRYSSLSEAVTAIQIRPVDQLSVVTPARAESAPVAPRPRRDALLALIAALIINSELAVLLSVLGGRFGGEDIGDEISSVTGLPVLAELPQAGLTDPGVVEALRTLRTNLLFLSSDDHVGSLAVVGGERSSGKSFVSLNLARTLAGSDTPVVLVDGDLRTPRLHTLVGVDAVPGLADAMTPPYAPIALKEVPDEPGLRVLPAGVSVSDPAGLLGGPGFRHLLRSVKPGDMVVVDTPPLDLFADAAAIARSCDATILVINVRTVRRKQVTKMLDVLSKVGVKPVGIVLNRVRGRNLKSYEEYRSPVRPAVNGTASKILPKVVSGK